MLFRSPRDATQDKAWRHFSLAQIENVWKSFGIWAETKCGMIVHYVTNIAPFLPLPCWASGTGRYKTFHFSIVLASSKRAPQKHTSCSFHFLKYLRNYYNLCFIREEWLGQILCKTHLLEFFKSIAEVCHIKVSRFHFSCVLTLVGHLYPALWFGLLPISMISAHCCGTGLKKLRLSVPVLPLMAREYLCLSAGSCCGSSASACYSAAWQIYGM